MLIHEKIKEALISLNSEFIENHKLKLGNSSVRIGRSQALSHIFEREIANKLSKVYPDYLFLVDYPISLINDGKELDKQDKRNQPIYPDILIVKGIKIKRNRQTYSVYKRKPKVIALLDLKIDIGYVDLKEYSKNGRFAIRENKIDRAKKCKFNYIVGAYSQEEKDINQNIGDLYADIPKDIKKISLVASKVNSHGKEFEYINKMENFGYKVIFLLDNYHPNTIENIEQNIRDEIDKKKKDINKVLKFE